MLRQNGIEPQIIKPEVNETLSKEVEMETAVQYLALKKALAVEKNVDCGVIIAADTVVYKNRIIGKPKDRQDALNILETLRADCHQVATGVAIIEAGSPNRRVFCEVTEVCFKDYDQEDILAYVETDEPWDKAGGYAIQGWFAKYIDHIVGDYDNVIGFPWKRIQEELKQMGLEE